MKIVCVNYIGELHRNSLYPDCITIDGYGSCSVRFKPDSTLLANGKPFYIPDVCPQISAGLKAVIRINRLGKNIAERFSYRYYEDITIGVDLQAMGSTGSLFNAMDGSAVIGRFLAKDVFLSKQDCSLNLKFNENVVQKLNCEDLFRNADRIIAEVSRYATLKVGDLIFIGNIDGKTDEINIHTHIVGEVGGEALLDFNVL